MSRRNKKLRRRQRKFLSSGHKANHKLISGRTGSVQFKKRLSPKKEAADDTVTVLVPGYKVDPIPKSVVMEVIDPQPPKKFRDRNKPVVRKITFKPVFEPQSVTVVDDEQIAYGLILKATTILAGMNADPGSKAGKLLNHLIIGVENYEKAKP